MQDTPQDSSSHAEFSMLSIDGVIMNFTEFNLEHRISMVPNTKSKKAAKASDDEIKMPNVSA